MEYDFIGDVHGHADALECLLSELGYRNTNGAYRHSNPNRMTVFLGDLIDRGPDQFQTIDIARRMRDAGTAYVLMGNHELNAIGYATPAPDSKSGRHLRIRGSKNRLQHKAFLDAVGEDSQQHKETVEFFSTLPLFFEAPQLQAVHACWHPDSIKALRPHLSSDGIMDQDALLASFDSSHHLNESVETILKGLEVDLPEGFSFVDKSGISRTRSRIQWWKEDAINYRSAVIPEKGLENIPEIVLPEEMRVPISDKITFFGHYWMNGQPRLISQRVACLDYSIAKDGVLAAYSWQGEDTLDEAHLSWVGNEFRPSKHSTVGPFV